MRCTMTTCGFKQLLWKRSVLGIAALSCAVVLSACGSSSPAKSGLSSKKAAKRPLPVKTTAHQTTPTGTVSPVVLRKAATKTIAMKTALLTFSASFTTNTNLTNKPGVGPSTFASSPVAPPGQGLISVGIPGKGKFNMATAIGSFELGKPPNGPSNGAPPSVSASNLLTSWLLTKSAIYIHAPTPQGSQGTSTVPSPPSGYHQTGTSKAPTRNPTWTETTLSQMSLKTAHGQIFALTYLAFSPLIWLNALKSASGTVTVAGTGKVNGTSVTEYLVSLSSSSVFNFGTGTIPAEVSIDTAGLIRAVSAVVVSPQALAVASAKASGAPGSSSTGPTPYPHMMVTIDLSGFGLPVSIKIPPNSQVGRYMAAAPNYKGSPPQGQPSAGPPSGTSSRG